MAGTHPMNLRPTAARNMSHEDMMAHFKKIFDDKMAKSEKRTDSGKLRELAAKDEIPRDPKTGLIIQEVRDDERFQITHYVGILNGADLENVKNEIKRLKHNNSSLKSKYKKRKSDILEDCDEWV